MNLISTHDFNFHPLCVRRNTTLIFLVNSQKQCSQVIQTQARKCDGMHMLMPFTKERASLYSKLAKPKLHLSVQSSLTGETRHFDALTHNLYFCAYSGLQKKTELKNDCACHQFARENWGWQGETIATYKWNGGIFVKWKAPRVFISDKT